MSGKGELKIVKCPLCGKVLKTRGNYFFRCCGIGWNINEHKITDGFSLKEALKSGKNEQKNGKNEVKTASNGEKIRIILKENGDNYEK